MVESAKPHWAWPHIVGVLVAIVAYFIIYRFTGDSDLFIAVAAIAMGVGGVIATWFYIRFITLTRTKNSSQD